MNFVFDVDGTLTPSRRPIDSVFASWFLNFAKLNDVYLVSGSDYAKSVEQLGSEICESVAGVYSCSGNALYVNGKQVFANSFELSPSETSFLLEVLEQSAYPTKTGNHIEMRTGLCNFSILGRNATRDQRREYVVWDKKTKERDTIASKINAKFPKFDASVAGETGIDICLCGKDKSQVAPWVSPFVFFGDAIRPGGNDFTIAQHAVQYFKVGSWEETFEKLKSEFS